MSIVAPIVNIVKLQCGVDVVRSSPDVLEPVYAGMALSPVEICDPTNLRTALNVLLSVLALGRFRQLLVFITTRLWYGEGVTGLLGLLARASCYSHDYSSVSPAWL